MLQTKAALLLWAACLLACLQGGAPRLERRVALQYDLQKTGCADPWNNWRPWDFLFSGPRLPGGPACLGASLGGAAFGELGWLHDAGRSKPISHHTCLQAAGACSGPLSPPRPGAPAQRHHHSRAAACRGAGASPGPRTRRGPRARRSASTYRSASTHCGARACRGACSN